jgi:Ca2+-binding RTX toxin-like protein
MPVISAPTKIILPGVYTLSGNIVLPRTFVGSAIEIKSSDVTIDLNGFSIINQAALSTTTNIGISSTDHSNVTIKNGLISGFLYGVKLASSDTLGLSTAGHNVNSLYVKNSSFRGIVVFGQDSIIKNNIVDNVFGTKVFSNAFAAGIETFGPRSVISGNSVREVHGSGYGEGLGISVSSNGIGSVVERNTISDAVIDNFRSFGIWVGGGSQVTAKFNTISGFTYGQGWSSENSNGLIANNTFFGVRHNLIVSSASVKIGPGNSAFLTERADSSIGTVAADTIISLGGNDVVNGLDGDDTLFGGADHDLLIGSYGNDNLIGETGDDTLRGGAGGDLMQGGAGIDTADYSVDSGGARVISGITVSLEAPNLNTGEAQSDSYIDIENLQLTDGNDVAYGNSKNNRISGGLGDDVLYGNDGDDTLSDAAGSDAFFGGSGFDTVDYSAALGGITIDIFSQVGRNTGAAAGDTYDSIENVVLTRYADLAFLNNDSNIVYAGNANDSVFGFGGNDQIYGEDGHDVLYGGDGADLLAGGNGFDYASYDDLTTGSAIVSLANQSFNGEGASGDALTGIEGLILSRGNDVGFGNAGANWLYGGAGDDTLYGYEGKDNLIGGAGADRFMFDTRPVASNIDTVEDFVSGTDRVGLAYFYYGGALSGTGIRLVVGAEARAKTSAGTILFDTTTKVLSYDGDGRGNAAAVPIAVLEGVSSLKSDDLFFI